MLTRAGNSVEEEGISLMFKQQREQWDLAQDQMATVKPVFRPAMGGPAAAGRSAMEPVKPPPPGYTCFRCGEKGHFINACPTIGDKEFDNKPKIKKATGIPSMFLKAITNKDSFEGAMMVTQDGDLVQAVPNEYQILTIVMGGNECRPKDFTISMETPHMKTRQSFPNCNALFANAYFEMQY